MKIQKNIIYVSVIVILLLILSFQCTRNSNLSQDNDRLLNNLEAYNDTISTFIDNNGNLTSEILAYKISLKELQTKYDTLFDNYEFEKNKPPRTLIQTQIKIVEKINNVPVYVFYNGDSSSLYFSDTLIYDNFNSRLISGNIPYLIEFYDKMDSSKIDIDSLDYFYVISPDSADFKLEQKVQLLTGLSYDNKNKKPFIWVKSSYPGLDIIDLTGADIVDDKVSRKSLRKARKRLGIGLHVGYGINSNLKPGLHIGLGLNYTPKIFQF